MKPNVVIIVVDALRADRVGPSSDYDLTPNIDQLANESCVFTNAFTTITTTDPAITSLHTGLYPLSHGIINHGSVSKEEKRRVESVIQLQEVLQEDGYHTKKIGRPLGRWHKRGFDSYPPISDSNKISRISNTLNNIHPLLHRVGKISYNTADRLRHKINKIGNSRKDEKESKTYIKELRQCLQSPDPFYAMVHLMDTHIPYTSPADYVHESLKNYDEGIPLSDLVNQFPEESTIADRLTPGKGGTMYEGCEKWEDTEISVSTSLMNARYDAAVRNADQKIGTIVSELEQSDKLDNTLLFVLADHGESLGQHGIYYEHHGLYDDTSKIPMLVRTPDKATSRFDQFVQITDIMPTVMDYLDITHAEVNCDGQSLFSLIDNDKNWKQRNAIIADESYTQRRRMIRTKRWKYIKSLTEDLTCDYCLVEHAPDEELYNLQDDPDEMSSVCNDNSEVKQDLQEKMETLANSHEIINASSERTVEYDDESEVLRRLEKLGYK